MKIMFLVADICTIFWSLILLIYFAVEFIQHVRFERFLKKKEQKWGAFLHRERSRDDEEALERVGEFCSHEIPYKINDHES